MADGAGEGNRVDPQPIGVPKVDSERGYGAIQQPKNRSARHGPDRDLGKLPDGCSPPPAQGGGPSAERVQHRAHKGGVEENGQQRNGDNQEGPDHTVQGGWLGPPGSGGGAIGACIEEQVVSASRQGKRDEGLGEAQRGYA